MTHSFIRPQQNAWVQRVTACVVLFGVSAFLMLSNLGFPRGIIFDETYYITHAQKYLNGDFFLQTHPPLGKLLIALGQAWLHPDVPSNEFANVEKIQEWNPDGDITGYRLMPALFGMLNPLLVFGILVLILRRELVAFALTLFVVFDNALIVQSRAAMLDSFLIFFLLAAVFVFGILVRFHISPSQSHTCKIPLRKLIVLWALWGAVIACAANVKMSGWVAGVLVAIYGLWLLRTRQFRRVILFGIVFILFLAIVYLGLWQIHFSLATHLNPKISYGISQLHRDILNGVVQVDPLTRFVVQLQDGLRYHINSGFNVSQLDLSNPNEIGSPWYWWLVGGRAINYRWETIDSGIHQRYVDLIGNPITWLAALIGIVGGFVLIASDLIQRHLEADHRWWLYALVVLWLSYMSPMILTTRVTYLYHYLPALVVGVILFGIILTYMPKRFPDLQRDVTVIALVLLVFVFWNYKPLTYYEPLSRTQFQERNIWSPWDLRWK